MALVVGSALVFLRILASVLTAPLMGHQRVPVLLRIGLAVLLTLVTVPLLVQQPQFGLVSQQDFFSAAINELLIGATLGLGVTILISAAQVAGQVIGQLAGINLSDPLGGEASQMGGVLAGFFNMLSLAVFALMGGPELMVTSVLDTFQELPLGESVAQSELLQLITVLLGQSLSLAVRAVGPAVAALFIATVALNLISRTVPQLNMLQFGLNSNLVVLWLAILLTLSGCVWLFVDDIQIAVDRIRDSLTVTQNASAYVTR